MQINDKVLETLSEEHHLPIAKETYQDLGKSAFKGEHLKHELGAFLTAIKDGVIAKGSILVVYSLDRLSRLEIGHAKQTYLDLTNNGINIYSIVDNHLYRAHNAADEIISTITFERSHNESKTKSQRVVGAAIEGLKKFKETGLPQSSLGRVPFWIDQRTNTLNSNAEGVVQACKMYLEGVGGLSIKKYLDEYYPYAPVRKKGNKQNLTKWDYTAITQVFDKPSLIGEKHISVNGEKHVLENYYPPLLDVATYLKLKHIKSLKQGRTSTGEKVHLLKGIGKCSECGGALVLVDKGGANKNYVCSNAAKGNHPKFYFNTQLLELVTLHLCSDHFLTQHDTEADTKLPLLTLRKQKLEEELTTLTDRWKKKKSERILDLIEESESDLESVEQEIQQITQLSSNGSVTASHRELQSALSVYNEDVMGDFQHDSRREIKSHLLQVVKNVVVSRMQDNSKGKFLNRVALEINFINGQTRGIVALPFEYPSKDALHTPLLIMSDNKDTDILNRTAFHKKLLESLHTADLLRRLYPSKGMYQWKGRNLIIGEVKDTTIKEMDNNITKLELENQILTSPQFQSFVSNASELTLEAFEQYCTQEGFDLDEIKNQILSKRDAITIEKDTTSKQRWWINSI